MEEQVSNTDQLQSPKKIRKKKTNVKAKLTEDQNKTLASVVKQHALLWDLSNPLHKSKDAREAAWSKIANVIGLDGKPEDKLSINSLVKVSTQNIFITLQLA